MPNPIEGKRYVYIGYNNLKLYHVDTFDKAPIGSMGNYGDVFIGRKAEFGRYDFLHEKNMRYATEYVNRIRELTRNEWEYLFVPEDEYVPVPTELQSHLRDVAHILEATLQTDDMEIIVSNLKLCIDTLRREGY